MIFLTFKKTTIEDEDIYKACFENDEFAKMLYYPNGVDIKTYIAESAVDYKFVVLYQEEKIGFIHFYYNSLLNKYTYVGGLHPSKFNSGLGVYLSVAILDYMFAKIERKEIFSGVFSYNNRSYKMLLAIGFKVYKQTTEKHMMSLTLKDFNNSEFVNRIKQRVKYTVI